MKTNLKRIPSYIWITLLVQLLFLEFICFDLMGHNVPIIRQIIGFIFLTFVPGTLIIKSFNLNSLGITKNLLYSVGLSVSFVMFTGFLMNMLYPLIGIYNPISIYPLSITFNLLVLFLLFMSFVNFRTNSYPSHFSNNISSVLKYLFSLPNLFILLLPFLSVFGALRMYLFNDNRVSLLLIFLIVVIVGLISFRKIMPTTSYPLVVFVISLSLLWNNSLISYELVGPDIFWEFTTQEDVIINSTWNSLVHFNINGLLSTVMLTPIYSIFLNLDSTWVFKIIFPLIFSLLPLSLFQIYREQTNDNFALLSAFFFMSFPVFFSEMIQLPRQQIAELFVALSVLLFIDKNINLFKKSVILMVFLFSIVVSHYGTSYLYLLYLILVVSIQHIFKLSGVNILYRKLISKLSLFSNYEEISSSQKSLNIFNNVFVDKSSLTLNYLFLSIVFCIGWYIYISSGSMFESGIRVINHISSSLISDFFSFDSRDQQIVQALGLSSMRSTDIYWSFARIFQYITQFFILIGVFRLFTNLRKTTFRVEFIYFVFVSLVLIGLCIVLPHFSKSLNMSRIYHLTLIFLSPFFLLGGLSFFEFAKRKIHYINNTNLSYSTLIKLTILLVLIPYFLFTSGAVFEVTDSQKTSLSLSLYDKDSRFYTLPETSGSNWFNQKCVKDYPVYNDGPISSILLKSTQKYYKDSLSTTKPLGGRSYLFLRRWNIITDTALIYSKQGLAPEYLNLDEVPLLTFYKWNSVYNNGESKLLYY